LDYNLILLHFYARKFCYFSRIETSSVLKKTFRSVRRCPGKMYLARTLFTSLNYFVKVLLVLCFFVCLFVFVFLIRSRCIYNSAIGENAFKVFKSIAMMFVFLSLILSNLKCFCLFWIVKGRKCCIFICSTTVLQKRKGKVD